MNRRGLLAGVLAWLFGWTTLSKAAAKSLEGYKVVSLKSLQLWMSESTEYRWDGMLETTVRRQRVTFGDLDSAVKFADDMGLTVQRWNIRRRPGDPVHVFMRPGAQ